tara:strand:- start:153 stop:1550 length:1398 start_codon:yes stop_codon:yes gene_type:complete
MLTINDASGKISRRKLLSIGSLGLGGLSLASLLNVQAQAATLSKALRNKSVIFLFQQGGPSQFETLDPKPLADESVRTVCDVIPTALPGVHFGEYLPRLSQLADRFTTVRNFQTLNAGHNIQPIVGPHSLETSLPVHYSRVVGTTRKRTGMPTSMILYPQAVSGDVPVGRARGNLQETGPYGSGYAPFVPGKGGQLQADMELNLTRDRFFGDRKALLSGLDRLKNEADSEGQFAALDEIQRQAYEILLGGGVSRALDLTLEDPQVLAKYDTSQYATRGAWDKVNRGKQGLYDANAGSVGKLLCLARRLCEAGCGFVTIHASYAGVWDMHADGNNLNMIDGMNAIGWSFDHAISAFIEDVESRGLQDDILLVCCGEMGRTPRINKNGGRDHWAKLAPLLLYGAGFEQGRAIGSSDKMGGEPADNPLDPSHLISTIMNTMFNIGELRLVSGIPSQVLDLGQKPQIEG